MKREVIFAPLARLEFEDAVAFYGNREPGLSERFQDEVDKILEQILQSPERFRAVSPTIRKATSRQFPYSIYYTIEPKGINVVSVFHGARNPEELDRRLK
jgi:plasmid stabilization system protein ParE